MARTTLDLDEALVAETQRASGAPTKTAAIEEAMREFVNSRRRQKLLEFVGSGVLEMTPDELRELRGKPRTGD
jgi:Arc/MetJ family transcription regulator